MRSRIAVAAVSIAVLSTFTPAARACSCAGGGDPRDALEHADAAFIGRALPSPSSSPTPVPSVIDSGRSVDYRFHVDEGFKADLGAEITVTTSASGGTCGFYAPAGKTAAMFLHRYKDHWTSGLCSQTTPEMLRKIAAPLPAPDGAPPVRFILGGSMGPVRTFSLDAQGRTLRYAEDSGITSSVGLCPGSHVFAELVRGYVEDKFWKLAVATRDVDTLRLRTQYGFTTFDTKYGGSSVHAGPIACLDPGGRSLAVYAVHDNRVAKIVRVEGERETTVYDGRVDGFAFSDHAPKAFVASGNDLLSVDLRTGAKRTLAHVPDQTQRIEVSPDDTHAIISATGGDDAAAKGHYLVDLTTGRSQRIPMKLFSYQWADARSYVLVTKDGAVHVDDLRLHELAHWPDWGSDGVVADGVLYAVEPGRLRAASVRTGPPRDLRHFDFAQSFDLVVVPLPPPTASPAPTATPAPVTPSPAPGPTILPQAEPSASPSSSGVPQSAAVFAAGLVLAAVAYALERRRPAGR